MSIEGVVENPLNKFHNTKEKIIDLVNNYIDNNCPEFKKKEMKNFLEENINKYFNPLMDAVPQEINGPKIIREGNYSASTDTNAFNGKENLSTSSSKSSVYALSEKENPSFGSNFGDK